MLKYKFFQGLASSSRSIRDFLLVYVTLASKIYAGKSKSDVKVAKQDFRLLHTLTLNNASADLQKLPRMVLFDIPGSIYLFTVNFVKNTRTLIPMLRNQFRDVFYLGTQEKLIEEAVS